MFKEVRFFGALAILITAGMPAAAEPQNFPQLVNKHSKQYPGCPGAKGSPELVTGVDASDAVTSEKGAFLKGAQHSGIKIILRYYEWPDAVKNESREAFNKRIGSNFNWKPGPIWKGKRLGEAELKEIHKNFKVAVVFQHDSSWIRTFQDPARPAVDAKAAIDLAQQFGQPINTVIFFGADFAVSENDFPTVEQYFKVLSPLIKTAHYKVGVYGEGYVCKMLKQNDLVSHCWLSQSTGKHFVGSIAYDEKREWQIKQCANRKSWSHDPADFNPDIIKGDLDDVSF